MYILFKFLYSYNDSNSHRLFCSDSDEDNEVFEEAIDQPLTTEGTLELAKNWTLRYSHTIGQSDTGSNEYEDSSDEYTSEGIIYYVYKSICSYV